MPRPVPLRHHAGPEEPLKQTAQHRQRMAGIGELKAHQHHEAEAEEEENQPSNHVLNADDLVVGGENIRPPPAELMMIMPVSVMRIVCGVRVRGKIGGCVHMAED